jgi:hypothetical protein
MLSADDMVFEAAQTAVRSAKRVLVLSGAGVSAASGIPTFRGAGGLWRRMDVTRLATPSAFARDPGMCRDGWMDGHVYAGLCTLRLLSIARPRLAVLQLQKGRGRTVLVLAVCVESHSISIYPCMHVH